MGIFCERVFVPGTQIPRISRPGCRGGVGMRWLRTVRSGVPFVTATSLLLYPLVLSRLTHVLYRHALYGSAPCNSDSDTHTDVLVC